MNPRQIARRILPPVVLEAIRRNSSDAALQRYVRGGRVPWSPGYDIYSRRLIARTVADPNLMERFRLGDLLPRGYGVGVDERCIEYPWLLAQLHVKPECFLDAGSTLNHEFILDHPLFRNKVMHILSLGPEPNCFWQRGICYLFHDLRDIPIRDSYYDTIACISTLEHIAFDNTRYTQKEGDREHRPGDFIFGIRELARVLKPGGTLYLSVPFGLYHDFGTFQQFDRKLLSCAVEAFGESSEVVETFYRYTAEGWNAVEAEDCAECEYVEWISRPPDQWPRPLPVEPDRAAAARAVACVRLLKA